MAKFQRGNSVGSEPEKELGEKMSDLSDDEGPEEVTFYDSKVIALKSAKDVRDSVQRYSGLGLLSRMLARYSGLKHKSLILGVSSALLSDIVSVVKPCKQ